MSPFGIFASKTGHPALFAELCRFHQLDRNTRKILDLVVQHLQLPRPVDLFLDPALLRRAIELPELEEVAEGLGKLEKEWFDPEAKRKTRSSFR